ncbi:MAG: hypothetical protein Q4E05_11620 [Pseudoclavibacter sp.]|nr:hypothetical protein [Pseudoclavibacter sp.]
MRRRYSGEERDRTIGEGLQALSGRCSSLSGFEASMRRAIGAMPGAGDCAQAMVLTGRALDAAIGRASGREG